MKPRRRQFLSSDLESVRTRYEEWRANRVGRARVPESLWELAVPLVKTHGVAVVAKALTLNYAGLKRRASEAERRGADSGSPFVEFKLGQPSHTMECEVELLDTDGAKTTIRLRGASAVDVAALASLLQRRGR